MVDQGFRFFKEMEKHEYDPNVNTYNTIIDGLCRVGKVKIAHNMLKGMVKRGHQLSPNILSYCGLKPTSITYNTLIQRLHEAKRFDRIKEILERTLGGGGLIPDTCTFNTLITYHCNVGNMDEEIQVFKNMSKLKEPDSSTYSILIRSFSQKGYFKRAEKLFDDIMKKKVLLCSDGCTTLVAAYNPMFEYLCRTVKAKKAEKVFRQLMRKGTQDLFAYELLIMGLLQKSEPKVAYDTLEKMLKCSHLLRSSNFHQILTELIKKKCASECSSLVKLMLDNKVRQNISLLTDTVRILFLAGLKEKAFEILRCLYENEYMNVLEALVPYRGQALDPHATSQTQAQLHLNVATSRAPQPVDHSVAAVGQPKDLKTFIDLKPPEFGATPSTIEPQKFIDHCEKTLTTLGLKETRGVEFTTFLFRGFPEAWWTSILYVPFLVADPRVKVRQFMDVLEARYRGPMIWDVHNGSYAEVVDTTFLLSLIMRWK
ncbi:hypothetical protein BC332_07482 [Capsicum chinense]|nr:hypothetical protein BC332_07482 [Capsicum chinense]